MKMFMATLEGKAWFWYESFPNGSLYSLADFHVAFYEMYEKCHPSLLLVKDYCKHCVSLLNIWRIVMKMMSSWMRKF